MIMRSLLLLSVVVVCKCYSSFWAPLFDARILNYRVDAPFPPDAGKGAREQYERRFGVRGVNLVADLGNGKGPSDYMREKNGHVQFYYTYNGADPPDNNYE